jgi:hypothetical protein
VTECGDKTFKGKLDLITNQENKKAHKIFKLQATSGVDAR